MSDDKIKAGVYIDVNGDSVPFMFNSSPSMYDKINFVSMVTDVVVGDTYASIARDMFFDFYLVAMFTDIDISYFYDEETTLKKEDEITSRDLVIAAEKMVNETNIVDIVTMNMGYELVEELSNAVDADIEYRTGIHKDSIEQSLTKLIDTLERKVSNIDFDNVMDVGTKLAGISGELTPERILEAYANTDIYKKKLVEKEEAKEEKQEANED